MINKGDLFSTTAGATFRLLAVNGRAGKEVAYVFGMDELHSLPQQWALADLKARLKCGEYKCIAPKDLLVSAKVRDAEPGAEQGPAQLLASSRWNLIEVLVSNKLIYRRKHRGRLVAARAAETGASMQTIMTGLRLYWRGGMTRDALLGAYHRRGTPLQTRNNSTCHETRDAVPVRL